MSNFNTNPTERLQEFNKCLANVKELAGGPIGLERLDRLMQFSGIDNVSSSAPALTVSEILSEVEAAGIELTPGLVLLVNSSSPQNVANALSNYIKAYGKGGGNNPTNLFYRILENENRR
ncbi:hypothetical protein NIES2119_04330 [[Phormidium ambiguum] IAM M-71]|uniref:Uncharacterized protein n=1 Tax=[Phormidium ambiguum] IAM M-71 TaxID=454136 RepID=A0A1U7IRY4_9CYAN|nr:hypothetical protein [Phormidium ambiguum]OKH40153.1 hypothetical protein NIES2119_04330 [Phormidium ambiguum IAM M-71]